MCDSSANRRSACSNLAVLNVKESGTKRCVAAAEALDVVVTTENEAHLHQAEDIGVKALLEDWRSSMDSFFGRKFERRESQRRRSCGSAFCCGRRQNHRGTSEPNAGVSNTGCVLTGWSVGPAQADHAVLTRWIVRARRRAQHAHAQLRRGFLSYLGFTAYYRIQLAPWNSSERRSAPALHVRIIAKSWSHSSPRLEERENPAPGSSEGGDH